MSYLSGFVTAAPVGNSNTCLELARTTSDRIEHRHATRILECRASVPS